MLHKLMVIVTFALLPMHLHH